MAAKCVHIVNLATVREVERAVGRPIDPLRFRANLYLEGLEPWSEFAWLDREIGIGPAKLAVFARTQRCEATNVDPATGARDMAIPAHLMRTWGHQDLGIYAKVMSGGEIAVGAPVDGASVGAGFSAQPELPACAAVSRAKSRLSPRRRSRCARASRGGAGIPAARAAAGSDPGDGGHCRPRHWLLLALRRLRAAFALPAVVLPTFAVRLRSPRSPRSLRSLKRSRLRP